MTFYMNQYDLGATLGMVASTRPERWARAPGPGPLEAEGRLLIGFYENSVMIFGIWAPCMGPWDPWPNIWVWAPCMGPWDPWPFKKV